MEHLIKVGDTQNAEAMTSLQIAEITSKDHKNILRDIDGLLAQGLDKLNFEPISYIDSSNRNQRCYNVTKKGCLILASGYDALLRERIINRWEELEHKSNFNLPQTFPQALMLAAQQAEEIEKQKLMIAQQIQQHQMLEGEKDILHEENKTLAEKCKVNQAKANYVDDVLQSTSDYTFTEVAKYMGLRKAVDITDFLQIKKILFRQGKKLLPYAPYADKKYWDSRDSVVKSKTTGIVTTSSYLTVTEVGRAFIIQAYKKFQEKTAKAQQSLVTLKA